MLTPREEEAALEAISKIVGSDVPRVANRIRLLDQKETSVVQLQTAVPEKAPPLFSSMRHAPEGRRISDAEAGGHFLKLLQATMPIPGERKILSVLRHEFIRMSFSSHDFQEGVNHAVECGWITQSGMMVELTKAGRSADV